MRVCNELGQLINRGKTTCGCITRAKMSRLLFRGPIVARHLEVEGERRAIAQVLATICMENGTKLFT